MRGPAGGQDLADLSCGSGILEAQLSKTDSLPSHLLAAEDFTRER